MLQVPLIKTPAQNLSISLDGVYWRFRFYLSTEFTCVDIERDGTTLITGMRCFKAMPLLAYEWMYLPSFGNFIFDNDVDWEQFEGNCTLYYLNAAEYIDYQNMVMSGYQQVAISNMMLIAANHAADVPQKDGNLLPPPVITVDLTDKNLVAGNTLMLSLTVTDGAIFTWQRASRKEDTAWSVIQNGSSNIYTLAASKISDSGYYRCVITGAGGVIISNTIKVTVK